MASAGASMKLSCLPVSLYPDLASGRVTPGAWFRQAAALGLHGADLSVAHVDRRPAALGSLRQQGRDAGIEVAMLVTYSDFTHPDRAYRAAQLDDVRAWIEAAGRLGVHLLRLTAGQAHPAVPERDGLAWAAEGLSACVGEARTAGVRLVYENHTRGSVWTRDDFTLPAARFLEVVRRTEGSGLEILFDTANSLVLHDDPVHVLQQVIDRIGAIHLSDIRRAGAFEPTVIGTGAAPIPRLLEIVTASGFDGWVSIEEASRTGSEGLHRAVAFADRVWVEAGGRPRRAPEAS
jgi:sugar phosphate isomerase/epimerase